MYTPTVSLRFLLHAGAALHQLGHAELGEGSLRGRGVEHRAVERAALLGQLGERGLGVARLLAQQLVLLGAVLCGISAGIFWAVEAAIAIAYPEPWNKGRALGWWLTFRLLGQIMGGAINIGLNADRDQAGKVSFTVYLIFVALQASGLLVSFLLTPPAKVERRDGVKVSLAILDKPWQEIKATARDLFRPKFLMILLWIGQTVFAEAVFFTYLARQFPSPETYNPACEH